MFSSRLPIEPGHVQHNKPNRYLADIRWDLKSVEEELKLVDSWTTQRCFTRDEIDHARKVLSRIATLRGGE